MFHVAMRTARDRNQVRSVRPIQLDRDLRGACFAATGMTVFLTGSGRGVATDFAGRRGAGGGTDPEVFAVDSGGTLITASFLGGAGFADFFFGSRLAGAGSISAPGFMLGRVESAVRFLDRAAGLSDG